MVLWFKTGWGHGRFWSSKKVNFNLKIKGKTAHVSLCIITSWSVQRHGARLPTTPCLNSGKWPSWDCGHVYFQAKSISTLLQWGYVGPTTVLDVVVKKKSQRHCLETNPGRQILARYSTYEYIHKCPSYVAYIRSELRFYLVPQRMKRVTTIKMVSNGIIINIQ